MQFATEFRETGDGSLRVALDLTGDLAKVHLRDKETTGLFEFPQGKLREWPDCPDPQEPDVVMGMIVHDLLDGTDRSPVRDDDQLRIGIINVIIRHFVAG